MTQQELFKKIHQAIETKHAFAMFRYPTESKIIAYVMRDECCTVPFSENFSGFVMAPFDPKEDVIGFPQEACTIYEAEQVLGIAPFFSVKEIETSTAKLTHLLLVEKGLQFLKQKGCEKVVLSRQIRREVTQVDYLAAFSSLLRYSNAFVYCWYHPEKGMWIGATPETLLRVDGTRFCTMALAGTKVHGGEASVQWGAKEIHEQKVVADFIQSQLADVSLCVSEPYTIKAGNVAHIRTDIQGELGGVLSLQELIDRLHPTPAVCGIPVHLSKDFILTEEAYSRAFYTGYLGEYRVENQTKLYVNLRCMRLQNNCATIFVGGGITTDSVPELEWQETCEKSKLMLQIL
ncbi:chorismate-binding protein [Flavobacteriaceae bacterium F08102]|nr:chorismate-binding protein [Flavobacteriaceae bacterium F08102]